MDKETLSHYGWIVVLVLILAVMMSFATPFADFIAVAVKSTTAGFFEVSDKAFSQLGFGVDIADPESPPTQAGCGIAGHYEGDQKGIHGIAVTSCNTGHTYTCQCSIWTVPEGGTYYSNLRGDSPGYYNTAENTYQSGEALPCGYEPSSNDALVVGNYEYRYNMSYYNYGEEEYWMQDNQQNGWGVYCLNNIADPGPILETINNKPIVSLESTFCNYTNLTVVPTIPSGVTNMNSTFKGCTSITDAQMPTIPSEITKLERTFEGCTSLIDLSQFNIPNNMVHMGCTFTNCTNLKILPTLPSSLDSLGGTFSGCTSITDLSDYVIPNSVTYLGDAFEGCINLTKAPTIPENVTSLGDAFSNCTSLTVAPELPSGVTEIGGIFKNCTSLTTAPIIPESVEYMERAFYNCTSLKGTIIINAQNIDVLKSGNYEDCFYNVNFKTQVITLTGSCVSLDTLGQTGKAYCALCDGYCPTGHY